MIYQTKINSIESNKFRILMSKKMTIQFIIQMYVKFFILTNPNPKQSRVNLEVQVINNKYNNNKLSVITINIYQIMQIPTLNIEEKI